MAGRVAGFHRVSNRFFNEHENHEWGQ
jgi:hypothetical protein